MGRQHFENLPQGERKGRWDEAYMKTPEELRKQGKGRKNWIDVHALMPGSMYGRIKEYQEAEEIATVAETIRTLLKRGLRR